MSNKMFTVREAAKVLGVTTFTVRNWARRGVIRAVKIPVDSPGSHWFIPEAELNALTGLVMKGFSDGNKD